MENPSFYATTNGMQRRDASDFSDEFSEMLGKMLGRCLDVGSGPGDVMVDFILPKLNSMTTVVCSDISESMVNFGREKYSNSSRLSYIQLDIESQDLPKNLIGQFDNVTSFYCLHWCQDMRQVFENIFKLLRSEGTALITFIGNCPAYDSYNYLAKDSRYQPYMKDVNRYIPVFQHVAVDDRQKVLQTLVEEVGFEVSHCSVREKNFSFVNRDALGEFMLAFNPFVGRMPTSLRKEYKKDLAEETARCYIHLQENNNEDKCSVLCTYSTFVMYLRKPKSGVFNSN